MAKQSKSAAVIAQLQSKEYALVVYSNAMGAASYYLRSVSDPSNEQLLVKQIAYAIPMPKMVRVDNGDARSAQVWMWR